MVSLFENNNQKFKNTSSSKINKSTVLLVRSRSLELNGLALWNRKINYITLTKSEKGLGFSLIDYQQDPFNPLSKTMIVIRALVPNGVAQLDGRLMPGQRLVSINDIQLDEDLITPKSISSTSLNAVKQSNGKLVDLLKYTVDLLKSLPIGKTVRLGVQKPLPYPDAMEGYSNTKILKNENKSELAQIKHKASKKESCSVYSINFKSNSGAATEPLPRKNKTSKKSKRKLIITSSRYDLKQAGEDNTLESNSIKYEEVNLQKSSEDDFVDDGGNSNEININFNNNEVFFNEINDDQIEYGFVATSAPAILNREDFENNLQSLSDTETDIKKSEHHSFYASTNQLKQQTFEFINILNSGGNSKFNSTVELKSTFFDQQQSIFLKSKSMCETSNKKNEKLDDIFGNETPLIMAPLSMPEQETPEITFDDQELNKIQCDNLSIQDNDFKIQTNTSYLNKSEDFITDSNQKVLKKKKLKKNREKLKKKSESDAKNLFKLTVSNVDIPDENNSEEKTVSVENYLKTQSHLIDEPNLNENQLLPINNKNNYENNFSLAEKNSECLTNSAVFLNFFLNFNKKLKELEETNIDEVYTNQDFLCNEKPLQEVYSEGTRNNQLEYTNNTVYSMQNNLLVDDKQLITEEQFNQAFLLNVSEIYKIIRQIIIY